MNYEKKYKEALGKARQLCAYPTTKPFISDLQDLFPELKESEGEEVRKALIRFHKSTIDIDGIKGDEIVSWLEKQKEPELSEDFGEYIAELSKQFPEVSFAKLSRIAVRVKNWLEKQGEPFDDNIITREDEILQAISIGLTDIEEDFGWPDFGGLPIEEIRDWLEKQGEEKPVDNIEPKFEVGDWVVNDEEVNGEDYGIDGLWHAQRILEKTLGSVDGYQTDDGILDHKAAITAVKKLYGQKPGWSEEDEKMVKDIIAAIDTLYYHGMVNWLKSLKDRYTWKPSEEQMGVIEAVINNRSFQRRHLNSLYEQLKKLKGE